MKELTDTDPMPFGRHKDEAMQDVPARYLHYLWTHGMSDEWEISPVGRYIHNNMDCLKQEHPDGIWD